MIDFKWLPPQDKDYYDNEIKKLMDRALKPRIRVGTYVYFVWLRCINTKRNNKLVTKPLN